MAYVEDEKLGSTRLLVESSSATSLVLGAGKPLYSVGSPKKQGKGGERPVVLSFKAYFKEAVHESPLENHRIRKVEIFYYMEDNSIQIVERKQENSGVPQGNFMGRHQVPKDEDTFFGLSDLVIGSTITLYGRTYHIIDANPSTLAYLDKVSESSRQMCAWWELWCRRCLAGVSSRHVSFRHVSSCHVSSLIVCPHRSFFISHTLSLSRTLSPACGGRCDHHHERRPLAVSDR